MAATLSRKAFLTLKEQKKKKKKLKAAKLPTKIWPGYTELVCLHGSFEYSDAKTLLEEKQKQTEMKEGLMDTNTEILEANPKISRKSPPKGGANSSYNVLVSAHSVCLNPG